MRIVLAHGVLGFGRLGPLEYFNGVEAHLRGRGHDVATAHVDPIGSVADRAATLADFVSRFAEAGSGPVCIFAHSMAGLDSRRALAGNLSGVRHHVAALVTIGTPHLGSPVADQIERGDPAALMRFPMLFELQINQAALHDLTTGVATQADAQMTDVDGIHYIHVAGDMRAHGSRLFRDIAEFFDLPEANDGVVAVQSASTRCGTLRETIIWPADHAGLLGWNFDRLQPVGPERFPNPLADRSHLARYDDLVAHL
jgi:triacylglycerol lipase